MFGKKKESSDDNYASGYYTGFVEVGNEGNPPVSPEWEENALDADEHARHDNPEEKNPFHKWIRGCADGVAYSRHLRNNDHTHKGG